MSAEDIMFILVWVLIIYMVVDLFRYHSPNATHKYTTRLKAAIGKETPLLVLAGTVDYKASGRLIQPEPTHSRWQHLALLITPTRFEVYDLQICQLIFSFTPEQLQWVGLPDAYKEGYNQFWLQVEKDDQWYTLQIQTYKYDNRSLFLALRRFAFDRTDQVGAYRRRRGDIHFGPVQAEPAAQDIHGAWTLAAPVNLYLMPRFLVILQGNTVLRKIPVTAIQEIGALRRLDEPAAAGLVRFRAEEETFAFALAQHEALAEALATAAKRTLEEPLERKQKALDDDDLEDADWLDEFEADEPPRKNQAG